MGSPTPPDDHEPQDDRVWTAPTLSRLGTEETASPSPPCACDGICGVGVVS